MWKIGAFLCILTCNNLFSQLHDKNIYQTVKDYSDRQFTVRLEYDHPFDTITYSEVTPFLNMFDSGITMSDSSGNLLFYSNGLQINDYTKSMMENGDSLNFTGLDSDWYFYNYLPNINGYYEEAVSSNPIPIPGQTNQYLIVHHPSFYRRDFHRYKTFYSRIDMGQNNNKGAVIEKNVELPGESQCAEFCKHANGVDWWIITANSRSDSFYVFLLNQEGIIGPLITQEGRAPNPESAIHEINFSHHKLRLSPQGNFLVSVHEFDLDLFRFDRCTGEIVFIKNIKIPFEEGSNSNPVHNKLGGAEFSVCENYIYVQNRYITYQIRTDNVNNVPVKLTLSYDKLPYLSLLPNNKILLYSSALPGRPYNPMTGLISLPCQPNVSAMVNLTIFDHFPAFSPFIQNGRIPNLPNYRLKEQSEYTSDTCKNDFFRKPLDTPEIFQYKELSYSKLFRSFKSE